MNILINIPEEQIKKSLEESKNIHEDEGEKGSVAIIMLYTNGQLDFVDVSRKNDFYSCEYKILPKGHGDLIDKQELLKSTLCKTFGLRSVDIENAPTIVEAERSDEPSVTPSYNSIKTELKSCEDCISRQAALDLIVANHTELNGVNVVMYSPFCKDIKQLPPVTPQPKTGHWILADEQNKEDVENDNYRFICSECQCSDVHAKSTIVPYCWKCGAKMESEGK